MFPSFLKRSLTIRVDFPALDRLLDFLEANEQGQVDTITAAIRQGNAALKTSTSGLLQAVTHTKESNG